MLSVRLLVNSRLLVKFGGVKVMCQFSAALGSRRPNPPVVQGQLLFPFIRILFKFLT